LRSATLAELRAAVADARALLCDWDGCLARGDRLLPGVADFLRTAPPVAILSNNSAVTAGTCQAWLAADGVTVALDHIHMAGELILCEARATFADRPIWLVASAEMQARAAAMGLRIDVQAAEAVLVLRAPEFDFAALAQAANLVRDGAPFWISNPDASHPDGDRIIPETGALAAAIACAGGRHPDRVFGKPQPALFRNALHALDVDVVDALMIGDNPVTDLDGAAQIALRSLHVDASTWLPDGGSLTPG
jgi:HAD superfamily hydrolase (TIGR01450 family)